MADAFEGKKSRPKFITGTVEAVDAAKGTFSIKGKKETVYLKAGEKVKLDDLKIGDKVTVTHSDGIASKVVAGKKADLKKPNGETKEAAPTGGPAGPAVR
jgi:multidrug resistance efflux pump